MVAIKEGENTEVYHDKHGGNLVQNVSLETHTGQPPFTEKGPKVFLRKRELEEQKNKEVVEEGCLFSGQTTYCRKPGTKN